ncbi:MAG: hypothetical protein M0R17_06915 [Candidatus Omnitrophica bacterium]|jgi:hypothetical protein|nr:hypothetical protein [Candidatus Omnitrophota bacterium]
MQLQGLRLDGKFSDSAQYTWAHAKNILLSRGFDEIENEPGDALLNSDINGSIIGRISTPSEIIVFTFESSHSYIKHLDSIGTLTTLMTIDEAILSFNPTTYPSIYIDGVHEYNNEGDLIIAFTTGYHKPMIINITDLLISAVSITSESELKNYYLFPEFNHNTFNLTAISATATGSITNGGRLPSAAYFFSLTYEMEPDVNTNFGGISNPIFIVEEDAVTAYKQFKGNGSLVITTKAITINIANLDTSYNYFKLAIIQRTETGINCYITKRVKVNSIGTSVLIDDIDKLIPFNLNEVIIASPAFSTVKTITQSNKKLRLGNLTKPKKVSTADIYDHILISSILSVNWINDTQVSLSSTLNSYKDSVFIFNNRTFRSDEVYALYLGLKLKTGGYYGIYHIPGREAIGNELTDTTTVDGTVINNYRLGSTATKDAGGMYGLMGYWQNDDERYNNKYGTTLANNKIRHHRFPSAGQLSTWKGASILTSTKKGTLVNTLNFEVDEFYHAGDSYYGSLTPLSSPVLGTWVAASSGGNIYNSYTASYNQTLSLDLGLRGIVSDYSGTHGSINLIISKNASVVSNQTTYADETPDTIDIFYENDIELVTGDVITIEVRLLSAVPADPLTEYYGVILDYYSEVTSGHSNIEVYDAALGQEILGLRISLDWANVNATTKAELEAVVDGWEIFYAKRTLNNQLMIDQSLAFAEGDGYRFHGFDSMVNLLNIEPTHVKSALHLTSGDYTAGTYVNEITSYSLETVKYSKLTKIKYLPAYNTATIPDNTAKENCYYFETTSGAFDKRLVNLINVKENVYLDFSNQELVSTGIVKRLVATSAFSLYGGDTFVGHNSVLTFPTGDLTAPKIWYFPTETILNSGMRYEGSNNYEKFYPLTNIVALTDGILQSIIDMAAAGYANYYLYNNDYHLLNNLKQDEIVNDLTSNITKFPNRIYSSITQPLESSSTYWRKFKILDYFDMVNHKGAIYKMLGNEYIVYIQTDYSIFRGIVVDKLVTGDIDVALKSAEMFDRPLQELLDADGNYIKPWNREGTIITPYGLVAADLDRGAIYVISDKADEITKLGIEDWFRNRVKNIMTLHTTKEGIGNGVILGYDDIYKRLLVTLRDSPIAVTSVVRSLTTGTRVTVTTTASHGLTTGTYVRMKNWDVAVCNGVFVIVVTGVNTFYYTTTASTTGAVIGGTVTLYDSTMSYQFEKGQWVSFHDYIPDRYTWNSNGLYIFNNSKIYKMFAGNNGLFSGIYYSSSIDFIFNQNKGERFLLRSVKWTTNLEANNINYWNETISKLLVYSKNQCSNENTITKKSYSYVVGVMTPTGNTIYRDGEWIFNDVLDILSNPNYAVLDNSFNVITSNMNYSKNWYDKSKFIGKFVIVRLIYTNSSTVRKLRISNVDIDATNIL